MSEYFDVCPECKKNDDVTPKPLFACEHCGRLLCQNHKDARIVYIPTFKGEPLEKTKWGRAVLLELQKKNTHPCFGYSRIFWESFDAQSKREFALRNEVLDYLAHDSSFATPAEPSPTDKGTLGLCPQCLHFSHNAFVDYDAETATFQCEHCGFKFSQLKATPYDYVEPPQKPAPVEIPISTQPIIKQKHFPLKKVIAFSIIVLMIGFFIWFLPQFLSTNSNLVSPTPSTTSSLPTATPSSTSILPSATPSDALPDIFSHDELVNYVLSLINSDRQANGLQNVTLSSVNSAQCHAENMLENNYFSHWDINGYKPYMRYTLAGGKGSVAENCAAQLGFYSDIKEALEGMEWRMMFDDADSNWGHRDNILDPLHNRVSIGVAYDDSNVYLVQDFENNYVAWNVLNIGTNQVTLQGTIQGQQSDIQQIVIFYDNPTPLTSSQLKQTPYQDGYDAGTYVGSALPPNWQATEGITITADTWTQSGNNFRISFSLSQAKAAFGKGVYTLYLETGSSTADALLAYSVWIN